MLRPWLVKYPACHRSFLFAAAAMFVLLIGSAAKAECRESGDIAKPAWKWTVDERLAQRFAPEAMKARAAEHSTEERAFLNRFPEAAADLAETKETGLPRQVTDSIEGNKNPELFLSFELFDHLISMGLPPDANLESQKTIEQRAVALGFGRDLWKRLGKAAASYLELQRADERRARAKLSPPHLSAGFEMDRDAILYCRARARAFAAAKSEFGEENFLRLLYTGVTPGLAISYVVKDGLAGHLRFIDGGCR